MEVLCFVAQIKSKVFMKVYLPLRVFFLTCPIYSTHSATKTLISLLFLAMLGRSWQQSLYTCWSASSFTTYPCGSFFHLLPVIISCYSFSSIFPGDPSLMILVYTPLFSIPFSDLYTFLIFVFIYQKKHLWK